MVWTVSLLLKAGLAVFAVSIVARIGSPAHVVPLLDHWLYTALFVVGAALCVLRPMLVEKDRLAWLAIAVGLALNAAGEIWSSFVMGGGVDAPYPSIADGLYLAFYPCAYLGLVLLARPRVQRLQLSLWLDGAIAALGASAIVATFVIGEVVSATSGRFAEVATTLAYPICDAMLLCLVVTTASLCGWRLERTWWTIAAGVGLSACSDLVFAMQQAGDSYQEGTLLDVGWPAGFALVASAAWLRGTSRRAGAERNLGGALIVPGLFTMAAIAILAGDHGDGPFTFLAVATLLAAMARTGLAFRELRTLADVQRQAVTDELTGLGNRRLLLRRLDDAADRREPFALLVVDLDGFKEINDGLGHASGDEALIAAGGRFATLLGSGDLLVRLGGDEFAIVLEGAEARATSVARQISLALGELLEVSGVALRLGASIGIVTAPLHGTDPAELMRRADIAMYRAKRAGGGGHEVYEARADDWSPQRLALTEQLREAIRDRQLDVHYQPKALLPAGLVTGVEALVRWPHPEHGLLSPADFLPLADQSGLMHDLTVCVLERALDDIATLRERDPALTVAINVSVPTLLAADFPSEIDGLLAERDLPPSALEIEITEDVLMTDGPGARALIGQLRSRGIAVSIDDYGTGYSSLPYLRDLAVDWLKIDRSFVTELGQHSSAARIVESTIDLAHALGLRVIAEGVETQDDWNTLAGLGCDGVQGFLLARPLPCDELVMWLEAYGLRGLEGVSRAA